MLRDAWVQLAKADNDRYWSAFYSKYEFQAGVSSDSWPAIREPTPSLTIDLSPIFDAEEAQFVAGASAVDSLAHYQFTSVFPPEVRLVALDWQHSGYWLWPHRTAARTPFPVPIFPNGDYYIFLTEDMTAGTFGHPWEQSLCLIGESLVATLGDSLQAWLPIMRINGQAPPRAAL